MPIGKNNGSNQLCLNSDGQVRDSISPCSFTAHPLPRSQTLRLSQRSIGDSFQITQATDVDASIASVGSYLLRISGGDYGSLRGPVTGATLGGNATWCFASAFCSMRWYSAAPLMTWPGFNFDTYFDDGNSSNIRSSSVLSIGSTWQVAYGKDVNGLYFRTVSWVWDALLLFINHTVQSSQFDPCAYANLTNQLTYNDQGKYFNANLVRQSALISPYGSYPTSDQVYIPPGPIANGTILGYPNPDAQNGILGCAPPQPEPGCKVAGIGGTVELLSPTSDDDECVPCDNDRIVLFINNSKLWEARGESFVTGSVSTQHIYAKKKGPLVFPFCQIRANACGYSGVSQINLSTSSAYSEGQFPSLSQSQSNGINPAIALLSARRENNKWVLEWRYIESSFGTLCVNNPTVFGTYVINSGQVEGMTSTCWGWFEGADARCLPWRLYLGAPPLNWDGDINGAHPVCPTIPSQEFAGSNNPFTQIFSSECANISVSSVPFNPTVTCAFTNPNCPSSYLIPLTFSSPGKNDGVHLLCFTALNGTSSSTYVAVTDSGNFALLYPFADDQGACRIIIDYYGPSYENADGTYGPTEFWEIRALAIYDPACIPTGQINWEAIDSPYGATQDNAAVSAISTDVTTQTRCIDCGPLLLISGSVTVWFQINTDGETDSEPSFCNLFCLCLQPYSSTIYYKQGDANTTAKLYCENGQLVFEFNNLNGVCTQAGDTDNRLWRASRSLDDLGLYGATAPDFYFDRDNAISIWTRLTTPPCSFFTNTKFRVSKITTQSCAATDPATFTTSAVQIKGFFGSPFTGPSANFYGSPSAYISLSYNGVDNTWYGGIAWPNSTDWTEVFIYNLFGQWVMYVARTQQVGSDLVQYGAVLVSNGLNLVNKLTPAGNTYVRVGDLNNYLSLNPDFSELPSWIPIPVTVVDIKI